MPDPNLVVSKANSALLIVGMQRDVVGADGKCGSDGCVDADEPGIASMRSALAATAGVLAKARQAGLPIFYSAWGRPANGTFSGINGPFFKWANDCGKAIEGTRGYEFCDAVGPLPGEAVLNFRALSAFAGTDLASRLISRGINTIVVAGIPTQWSVEGSVRDAVDRGFNVVLLEDCCAASMTKNHYAAMEILRWLAIVMPSSEFSAPL